MHILLAAGLLDHKLHHILQPISSLPSVDKISLVRREPFSASKIVTYTPPKILGKNIYLGECFRLWKMLILCLTHKVDVLMGIHFRMHCVYAGLMGMVFKIPVIYSIIEDPKKYRGKLLFRFFIRRADYIWVRGNCSKEYLIKTYELREDQVRILPDYKILKLDSQETDSTIRYDFIFVGRFVPVKRLDFLLQVMAQLKKDFPNLKVGLMGEGPLEQTLKQQVRELGLDNHVSFLGFQKEVDAFLRQSRIHIMTSESEGLPVSLLEAMSCGVPSIMPEVGDIVDLARNEENALIVPALDQEAYAAASRRLLTDTLLYERLKGNALETIRLRLEEYSLEHNQVLWDGLFRDILDKRS